MKNFVLLSLVLISQLGCAQGFKGILKKATGNDSTLNNTIDKFGGTQLSNDDIISGLKEALKVGTENGTQKISSLDGFFKDAAIKVLMPDEAKKVEDKLRAIGLGSQVDVAILSMNRAAEDACKSAAPIFVNAIKQMSFADALSILKGGDFAATNYLKNKTTSSLTTAFRPVVETSLNKVDATKHWSTIITTYNKIPFTSKINPDLVAFVTEKALFGIFYQISLEEQKIRKNPLARTSDILKKVFSN